LHPVAGVVSRPGQGAGAGRNAAPAAFSTALRAPIEARTRSRSARLATNTAMPSSTITVSTLSGSAMVKV